MEVPSYTALLYLGLVAGIVAGNLAAHRAGFDTARVLIAQLILIPFALVGARVLYVTLHWRRYRGRPDLVLRGSRGGADLIGGLPVALLLSLPLLGLVGLPFWSFWDVTTFTILVGMLFGRFGCLLHGCCCGRETAGPLGLDMANVEGVVCRRIPTQLLEMGWVLSVLLVSIWLQPRIDFAGGLSLLALGAYALGRSVLDPLRERVYPWLGGITTHQAIYGMTALACALGWLWLGRGR